MYKKVSHFSIFAIKKHFKKKFTVENIFYYTKEIKAMSYLSDPYITDTFVSLFEFPH